MVHHVTPQEIDDCLRVFEMACKKAPNYNYWEPSVCRKSLEERIFNPHYLVLINEKKDGVLVGVATPSTFYRGFRVGNEFIYAESDGLKLVKEFIRWGKRWPNSEIYISTSFGDGRAEKLFNRMGFKEVGTQFKVT